MDENIRLITKILSKYLDPVSNQAFVFGSIPTGTSVKYSDYDIGVKGVPISADVYFKLEQEFEDSDLPCMVDIVDFNDVSEQFKRVAEKKTIPIDISKHE